MKILVFGHKGMLGRYVYKYLLERGFEVDGISREEFDASNFDSFSTLNDRITPYNYVVNCIGTIKPITAKIGTAGTFMVNGVFPFYLARACRQNNVYMFHITTDCVYSGKLGNYTELDPSDVFDDYGFSKSIGDRCGAHSIIRTSIIGEEVENKRSLLEWAISQKGLVVKGFTNHRWNGVTCLELAKHIENLIRDTVKTGGIHHFFSGESVTKFDLLGMISKAYDLDLSIYPTEALQVCNRTLSTIHEPYEVPSLPQQLAELKEFHTTLYLGDR